ncbi:hypothetical protein PMG71_18335 [Roseofilum sp. BLCC_M154]|uniref:Uncharacterized protein n=1 Tax=Roseofilum acuticapitatum BLCC-M154 TaxID=3022444 RepID=A0ABT7AWV3_9CYAN|nr:hypothetical protein [Roseofilum acuticapitatum]MDJ1171393.1 hypothetical protein [Roseofilum acuticapitatum BLCC-M154]
MKVTGTIERQEIGVGTWALLSETGEVFELMDAPPEILQPGLKCSVEGTIRDDVMTMAAIGPVLEVNAFELLS